MYHRKIPIDFDCGLIVAMEVVGSKWKFCLLSEIAKGVRRPKDLARLIRGASKRELQKQLRELELHGVVRKEIYHEVRARAEYFLTDDGESLMPLVTALDRWGKDFSPKLRAALDSYEERLQQATETLRNAMA